jgi:hypothetical protein
VAEHGISPQMVHEVDQRYAGALPEVAALVEIARPWVREQGPAMASALAAATLLERDWSVEMLAGLAGIALAELVGTGWNLESRL